MVDMPLLFENIRFRGLELTNRIIIAPMCQYSANLEGEASYWHEQQWGSYALSGAGMCIIEATAVQAEGRISYADLGLWNNQQTQGLKNILDKVRQISPMPFAVQLAHAGRKASTEKPWLGRDQVPADHAHGWQTVSASNLPFEPQQQPPHALSLDEIQQLIADFAQAAQRAVSAGFDLVEIHAAHGYLIHQFLSPLSNQRTDQYGGCLENRIRLCLEVFQAMLNAVPEDFPVGVRISAQDWVEGGWSVEESIILTQHLEQLGAAYIHVSSGGLDVKQQIELKAKYQVPFAAAIKQQVKIPVIAVGLITEAEQAEHILQAGEADAIGLARAIMYDPRWPWHAAAQLNTQIAIAPQYLRCQPHQYKNLFYAYKTEL